MQAKCLVTISSQGGKKRPTGPLLERVSRGRRPVAGGSGARRKEEAFFFFFIFFFVGRILGCCCDCGSNFWGDYWAVGGIFYVALRRSLFGEVGVVAEGRVPFAAGGPPQQCGRVQKKEKKKKKKGSNNSRTSHLESQWHDLATEGDYEVTHIAATEDSQKIPCRPCAVVSFLVPRSSFLVPHSYS